MEPQMPGESFLIEQIVKYLKAKGMFDEFRQECLADMDTKSSYQNLMQRIDGYTVKFLANETFNSDMNKNELRNKLRRSIEESGILNLGADHVVEQVITAKIRQVFFPRITEVVNQYIKDQNEMSSNFPEASASEKAFCDTFGSKTKPPISDPIADILSFSFSKSKPTTNTHAKTDNTHLKHADVLKAEKKIKEKLTPFTEKISLENPTKIATTATVTETKTFEKEKQITENNSEVCQVPKHVLKEEFKTEKIKTEDVKTQSSDTVTPVEENKANVPTPVKPLILQKKDLDKNKQKLKTSITHKTSSSSSEIKKSKKESSDDKPSDKVSKTKSIKSLKELSPPKKNSSVKSASKEDKGSESSKSKSFDTSNNKTESSAKKILKSSSTTKKDSSKHKRHSEKIDKSKVSKSSDKNDQNIHYDSSNSEKAAKNIHYSSSQDSSQSSDQEKSSFSSSKKERQKHFSKHAQKSEEYSEKNSKTVLDKNKLSDADESPKKLFEKSSKYEQVKEDPITIEIAKLSSCSNSFGSTSSVSSSPSTSKDNLSNSDEASENSVKEKKKNQAKEKDFCQNPSRTLPPPSPPPPSSSSLLAPLSETPMFYDTQSSSDDGEVSSNEGKSEESLIDSDLETKSSTIKTLDESTLTPSTYKFNEFYDIFLYSSSSSEFEGFTTLPEKDPYPSTFQDIVHSSELSVSSVHTSDLSSYDDTLSDEEFSFLDESNSIRKKKLTLREAQEIFRNKNTTSFEESQIITTENSQDTDMVSLNEKCVENSPSVSYDEKPPSSEPIRLLRRERKLNPRYASSEYTSIFNSKKETFITKRNSPSTQNNNACSSSNTETTYEKKASLEKEKLPKKSLVKSKKKSMREDQKTNNLYNSESNDETDISKISDIPCSNEINSFLKKDILEKNNKSTGNEHLKINLKLNLKNNSKLNRSSHSLKYKISGKDEASPVKRICNESSELISNENKPFNSEKQDMIEDKICAGGSLKRLGVRIGIKKDVFCKQRANNNGDVLNQKDIFSNNPHGKTIINAEKKTESDTSKELNDL